MILWGMGISQHVHATDHARCLIALSMMTGRSPPEFGPASAARPEQRAGRERRRPHSDEYPDYLRVDNGGARDKFEVAVGPFVDRTRAHRRRDHGCRARGPIFGMYIMARIPRCRPDVGHARGALAKLEMLVVQDIFLTETAYLADVILPARRSRRDGNFTNTDRLVQLAGSAEPPRRARQDWRSSSRWPQKLGRLEVHASARSVQKCPGHAVDRRHHVGSAGARRPSPTRAKRKAIRHAIVFTENFPLRRVAPGSCRPR